MTLRERYPAVGFGTSGVRALVDDLTPEAVSAYARAFAQALRADAARSAPRRAWIGWDLRPSSPAIAAAVCAGLEAEGLEPLLAGPTPTPALAHAAWREGEPAVMITGSHIPFDRNGIKFHSAVGEISKADERRIAGAEPERVTLAPDALARALARWAERTAHDEAPYAARVAEAYRERYARLVPAGALSGLRVGVYQHSAVGRDLMSALLAELGAGVVPLGRSDAFVPIDTEAVSREDEAMAAAWCERHALDAVVSTDGDGDRPWVCDERGRFVPGDVVGPLVAAWLGVRGLVTPVSSNSLVTRMDAFARVVRTRIGSPYVIEAMAALAREVTPVAGYEANGGFLLHHDVVRDGRTLRALPTRDALLPILALLVESAQRGRPLSALRAELPPRFTASGRVQGVDVPRTRALLAALDEDPSLLERGFGVDGERLVDVDRTDGLRARFTGGGRDDELVVHLRMSGNAPELRVYVEDADEDAAARVRDAVVAALSGRCR